MDLNEKKRILILCTGNSCRSPMAEAFAHEAGWDSYSAGIKPEAEVSPFAVKVMAEIGIDISYHKPQSISEYQNKKFFVVATVCNNAREACPVFTISSKHQIHHLFIDPADTTGNDKEITQVYRQVRNEIQRWVNTISGDYIIN